MSIFSELQKRFAKWRENHLKYQRDSTQFVFSLAAGLSKHIDAPSSYQITSDSGVITERYVQPINVTLDENGLMQCHSPTSPADVLTRSAKDGYWTSGIRLIVDQAANVHPKHEFNFMNHFIIRDQSGEVEMAGETFKFQTDDPDTLIPIYVAIVESMEKSLAQLPWETFPLKHYIGFKFPAENCN